ncbi:MAG TPA: M14 family metallocarboxypeptidase, partial [Catalimonadaceae bacterium]|nr:M14 family metallocarboxypeptidase [Catalimonadaceae bacterium]
MLLIGCISFKVSAQFNPQSQTIAERFFPEPELNIRTPAFQKKEGFTKYEEMMTWLNQTIKPHSETVSLSFIGESQKGKKIPLLILTRKNNLPKIRVWMQGGLHGDEPAGTEAMLHLIDQLLNNPEYATILNEIELALVPMANIDGYEKLQREAANGMDLNRDQTRLKAQESIALKTAFSRFQPAVALDFHEYRPYRKHFTRMGKAGITSRYDAMFLYSGNLNVPQVLRDFTRNTFVKNAETVLDQNGMVHHDYITTQKYGGLVEFNLGSVHSRSSATNFALSNCVSTLLEIRGVGIDRMSFKRRVKSSFLIALSYLQTTIKEKEKLVSVLKESAASQQPVVVTSEKLKRKDSIRVIDLASETEMKMAFTFHDALQSKPVLQRKRPTAYLLQPEEKSAAYRLKVLGLVVDSLLENKELDVESFEMGQPKEEEQKEEEEETEHSAAATLTRTVRRNFKKGTYVVYSNQPRFPLAAEVLEPENANGFVAMNVIRSKGNQ